MKSLGHESDGQAWWPRRISALPLVCTPGSSSLNRLHICTLVVLSNTAAPSVTSRLSTPNGCELSGRGLYPLMLFHNSAFRQSRASGAASPIRSSELLDGFITLSSSGQVGQRYSFHPAYCPSSSRRSSAARLTVGSKPSSSAISRSEDAFSSSPISA